MSEGSFELHIGAATLDALPAGSTRVLKIPAEDRLVKQEPRVLGWVEALDADVAFVKLYPPRGATWRRAAPRRARREYECLEAIHAARGRRTEPLFWGRIGAGPLRGGGVIATRLLPGVVSLRILFDKQDPLLERLDWRLLFESVDRMHEAGICHGGLSPKNVLVDPAGFPYLCDLAKALRFPSSIRGTRMAFFDLVHLWGGIASALGEEQADRLIATYSRNRDLVARLRAHGRRYRARKGIQRRRLRTEFSVRLALAWTRRRLGF